MESGLGLLLDRAPVYIRALDHGVLAGIRLEFRESFGGAFHYIGIPLDRCRNMGGLLDILTICTSVNFKTEGRDVGTLKPGIKPLH